MKVGIGLGDGEQLVPEIDELGAKGLKRRVPLAVPVGMGNDEDGSFGQGVDKITRRSSAVAGCEVASRLQA